MAKSDMIEHARWLEGKLKEARDGIGDSNVVIPDGEGGVMRNPAIDGYIAMSKEYRLTVEQMRKMGISDDEEVEKKSSLSTMRVIAGKKAV